MKIIENFLPQLFYEDLHLAVNGAPFPWHYNEQTSREYNEQGVKNMANFIDYNTVDSPQLVHMAFSSPGFAHEQGSMSDYFSIFKPMIYFIEDKTGHKPTEIFRMKANLMFKDSEYPENKYNVPHWDMYDPKIKFKTLLYYFNDSDGDTIFFKETATSIKNQLTVEHRVTPKANTAVLFDSSKFHASSPPRNSKRRMVLNIILV
jgi:hypothetical protein